MEGCRAQQNLRVDTSTCRGPLVHSLQVKHDIQENDLTLQISDTWLIRLTLIEASKMGNQTVVILRAKLGAGDGGDK
jgi:hypothetical protein